MRHGLYVILGLVLLATMLPWVQQGVPATDDFRHHLTKFWWINEELNEHYTFSEWQPNIYSGWPLTQFYHSLPYFILYPLNLALGPVAMLKVNMVVAMLLGVASMYYAASLLTKHKDTAIIAAILYALSPLHFEFAYLSGSISRQWAFVFVPLAFALFIRAVDERKTRSTLLAALSYAALMWSHLNVAYALALVFALYLVYVIAMEKGVSKNLLKEIGVFSIISLGLITFWLLPLVTESAESETSNRLSTVFGNAPPPAKASLIFLRGFGMQPEGRYFYVGIMLLLFALISALTKYKHKEFFIVSSIFCLVLTIFTWPLRLLPFLLIDYSIYFLLIALVPLCIMAAYGIRASAKLTPMPQIMVFMFLALIIVDVYPALSTYNWIDQPSEQFINPPDLIALWNKIGQVPGYFRVYSLVGQVPFMYHHKFEIGTTWMGFREGALKPIRQITDKLEEDLKMNPFNPSVISRLEYMGVRYLVLPCNEVIEQGYALVLKSGQFCAYAVSGAPLVSGIDSVARSDTDVTLQGINATEAIIVESCDKSCKTPQSKAQILDVVWDAESITFKTKANESTKVLVRSAYFSPRWRAYVNDVPVKITEVWPKYMLLDVPEGDSDVALYFESNMTHRIAQFLSLCAIVGVIFLWRRRA